MEFKIEKNIFEKTLASIIKIIPPRSTYTVLQNIIIETTDNNLSIEATDLDVFIKKVIPAEIKTPGKILVAGKKFLEITRESNVSQLALKLKELNFQIAAGNAHFNIPAMDYQEFPEVPNFPSKKWFEINIGELKDLINSTVFMVSKDISRKPMNGVLIQLKDNELRLVTTDGARLALNKRKMEGKVADGELIVGTKVFDLLDMGKEENLEIFTEERMVGLKSADTTIIARLIEGPYPNYEGVIPLSFKGNCSIEKDILDGALKRVSLVAPPYVKNVKFDFREHGILLSSSSPDVGEAKEEVPCVYDGEKMGIWFNASFVLEILRHITSESIKLNLTSSNTAALLKSEAQENLLYLLMPLRIDNWE